MDSLRQKAPDILDVRDDTGRILALHGNRLLLIEATILLFVPVLLYVFFHTSVAAILQLLVFYNHAEWLLTVVTVGYWVMLVALTLFFTLPLYFGFLRMASRLAEGMEVVLADVFLSFASAKSYQRSVQLSLRALGRFGALVATVWLTCFLAVALFEGSMVVGLVCGVVVLAEVAVGMMLLWRQFSCTAVALQEEIPMRDARKNAHAITARYPWCGLQFWLHYAPHLLLGLVTFGIFLIWEVLPRMCVSYFLYCRKLNDRMTEIGGI